MADKKKKFGANGLNALESAIETVSEAVENQQTESSQIVASPPVAEPSVEVAPQPTIATKEEQPKLAVAQTAKSESISPVQPSSPATQVKAEEPEVKVEITKGLNIPLPLSVYKRLSTMKIDSDAESLKSLGLKAIIEFLDKNGY